MKKSIVLLLCTLTFSLGEASSQVLPFLQIPQDPAITGMGGAGVALSSSAPLENNLADDALGMNTFQIGASYTLWQPSIASYGLMGVSVSYRVIPKLSVALSVSGFMSPEYETAQASGLSGGSFRPLDLSIGAGAAYRFSDNMAVGVAAKFINSSLGEELKGSCVSANLSFKYAANDLQAGVALNNLGTPVKYGDVSYSLPMLAKAGAAYTISGFTAALEADYVFQAGFMAGLGLQYAYKDMIYARAGYHLGTTEKVIPSHVSLGLGFRYAGVSLNVAWLTASKTLGNSLMFGLDYAF